MFQTCELNVDFITEHLGFLDELNDTTIEIHQNQNKIQIYSKFYTIANYWKLMILFNTKFAVVVKLRFYGK